MKLIFSTCILLLAGVSLAQQSSSGQIGHFSADEMSGKSNGNGQSGMVSGSANPEQIGQAGTPIQPIQPTQPTQSGGNLNPEQSGQLEQLVTSPNTGQSVQTSASAQPATSLITGQPGESSNSIQSGQTSAPTQSEVSPSTSQSGQASVPTQSGGSTNSAQSLQTGSPTVIGTASSLEMVAGSSSANGGSRAMTSIQFTGTPRASATLSISGTGSKYSIYLPALISTQAFAYFVYSFI